MRAASEASRAGLVSSVTTGPRLSWADAEHRAAMTEFRRASRLSRMRRGVKVAAELLEGDATLSGDRQRRLFVTLTYRPGATWRPEHVKNFLTACRKRFARKGAPLRYVWVLELTARGVPHYHVVFWIRASLRLPAPDRAGLWPHGWSQVQRARSPVGYLISYAAKADALCGVFPKGARIFGCGGTDPEIRAEKRWRLLPRYVREAFAYADNVRRCPGGGWLSVTTGEWIRAALLYVRDGVVHIELPSAA